MKKIFKIVKNIKKFFNFFISTIEIFINHSIYKNYFRNNVSPVYYNKKCEMITEPKKFTNDNCFIYFLYLNYFSLIINFLFGNGNYLVINNFIIIYCIKFEKSSIIIINNLIFIIIYIYIIKSLINYLFGNITIYHFICSHLHIFKLMLIANFIKNFVNMEFSKNYINITIDNRMPFYFINFASSIITYKFPFSKYYLITEIIEYLVKFPIDFFIMGTVFLLENYMEDEKMPYKVVLYSRMRQNYSKNSFNNFMEYKNLISQVEISSSNNSSPLINNFDNFYQSGCDQFTDFLSLDLIEIMIAKKKIVKKKKYK